MIQFQVPTKIFKIKSNDQPQPYNNDKTTKARFEIQNTPACTKHHT